MASTLETDADTAPDADARELLAAMCRLSADGERRLVVVPVAGRPPSTGDVLIGVEASAGLAPSVVVIRRDGYACWQTIHRSSSLRGAYAAAQKAAPKSDGLTLNDVARQLAQALETT